MYLDAIVVKVKDGAHVGNKAAHIAIGVDLEGVNHVLGIWVQATEGEPEVAVALSESGDVGQLNLTEARN